MRETNLLHDACLSFGKGDVTTRLILDEFDLNLPSLTSWLVVIIVVVVGGSTDARTFGASILDSSIAGDKVILSGRRVFVSDGSDVRHIGVWVQERSIGVDEVKQDRIPRWSTERGMMFLKIEWQAESSNALADGTGLGKVAMGKMGEEELMVWRWAICPSKSAGTGRPNLPGPAELGLAVGPLQVTGA